MRGPGPVDVLAARPVTETLPTAGPEGRNDREFAMPCRTCPPSEGSLKRRLSSRSFRYGYLVTTSPQSRVPPSTAPSQRVRTPASGVTRFRGVTGGVYKARERIHRGVADPRLLATPPSWRRISASNPNRDRLFGIRSTSRYRHPLYRLMSHVCSPGHKGHDDLTSSPPSSGLSPAVSYESPTECWQHRTGVALVAGLNPTSHDTS